MKLSFHVCNSICQEEFYAGVQAHYDAYEVEVPEENIPEGLKRVLENRQQRLSNNLPCYEFVTNIAIMRE